MADTSRISNAARRGQRVVETLPVCRVPLERAAPGDPDTPPAIFHEWLVTNGMGGYSSTTIANVVTRRYHGLLVAALPNPLGRMIMLNSLSESLELKSLVDFQLDGGIPTWRFQHNGAVIEKRIMMPYRQNTVIAQYRVTGDAAVTLRLTPEVHFRGYEASVAEPLHEKYDFEIDTGHYCISATGLPPLRIVVEGQVDFIHDEHRRDQLVFPVEEARGFKARGALWSPGTFVLQIEPGGTAALIGSTEKLEVVRAMTAGDAIQLDWERKRRLIGTASPRVRTGEAAQLVIAADQFVFKPVGRLHDTVRAMAVGEGVRTVIAGYHWFTDWGRDTMISLEGLTLTTGRHREAGFILRTFAQYVRDGLIPNMFPDGSDQGLYHTADATLWFFHALERYGQATGYWSLVEQVLPTMRSIVEAHLRGTRFGIGVDPADGLLRQGAEGYQLTWMDAKVEDWVVTPRRGKAVEINALWYNALCLLARWECDFGDRSHSQRYTEHAARVHESFNDRFWIEDRGYLYDVIDGPNGDDVACRPNQIFAIAMPNPVLDRSRWERVLEVVQSDLLTPVGLRSLAPVHADYKRQYFGDLRARDAAYHQGTVWAWLIGPWVDAWLKVHPDDRAGARRFLDGLIAHLPDFGVGSIAEIFDAEPPFTPRGCIAQAWSVAEVLRCLEKTAVGPSDQPS